MYNYLQDNIINYSLFKTIDIINFALFQGITLTLSKSLHNQGVLEQEKIEIYKLEDTELVVPTSPIKTQLIRVDSQSAAMQVPPFSSCI